jgi:hypothetical protein
MAWATLCALRTRTDGIDVIHALLMKRFFHYSLIQPSHVRTALAPINE